VAGDGRVAALLLLMCGAEGHTTGDVAGHPLPQAQAQAQRGGGEVGPLLEGTGDVALEPLLVAPLTPLVGTLTQAGPAAEEAALEQGQEGTQVQRVVVHSQCCCLAPAHQVQLGAGQGLGWPAGLTAH
jgi:hypothetical protein